ncbi:MAG: DeoR/GlpR family DNA-binding transcription regulator [Methanomethylovorans sp.]|nr:DeoR/GlpR family DNA-binding transcription regulator [Methanomethylovorans sp.]
MFQNERYAKIYEILQQRGSVTVQYLKKQLYVSEATIRRDLDALEKSGLLQRVWGGAMLRTVDKDIPSFVRMKSNQDKKEKIASIASAFLKSSSSIFFDSSTSCLPLVPYIAELKNITVVTNSLEMSLQLGQSSDAAVTLLGGAVYEDYILSGYLAVNSVRQFYTDMMFFSCSGISSTCGITSIEPKFVEVCQEMLKHTALKILLCDSSKVGRNALLRLADLNDVDYVIMDEIPENDAELISALGSRLITERSQIK